MSLRKRRKRKQKSQPDPASTPPSDDLPNPDEAPGQETSGVVDSEAGSEGDVRTSAWTESKPKVRRRSFCEAGAADVPLRIAMTPDASTEVFAHARESLDQEICGVLVGEVCQDEDGQWVFVKAAIRGTSAKKGGAHVTFTQETWEKIYEIKDRDYRKLGIVGWYHSHPGFGVTFSDMDKFIQQNFFSGETQFALVIDPLANDEAVCVATDEGIEYVDRIWIEGRPKACQVPNANPDKPEGRAEGARAGNASSDGRAVPENLEKRLRALESRLQQFLETAEEDRTVRQRWVLMAGAVVAVAAFVWIGFTISDRVGPKRPVELQQLVPVGVQAGPLTVPIGDTMVTWKLSDDFMDKLPDQLIQRIETTASRMEELNEFVQRMQMLDGERWAAPKRNEGGGAQDSGEQTDSPAGKGP